MHEDYWESCLNLIKKELEVQSYNTWFKPIIPISYSNKILTLKVPNKFFYEWIEEHYLEILNNSVKKVLGKKITIEYNIKNNINDNEDKINNLNLKLNNDITLVSNLNSNYNFNNFVSGKCNNIAINAGKSISEKPGFTGFNPLMIYGGVGQGKTHLLHAIGNQIKSSNNDNRTIYVSSEKFTSEFISALKNNSLEDFTNYYMSLDTLLIDDVQFLHGKVKTQEIFFHIFNHLNLNRKQIIISSDRSPKDLDGLEKRLVSRFKWGLTVELEKPNFETRKKILKEKVSSSNIKLSEEVIDYISFEVDTNIRELEGIIISLLAHSTIEKSDINLELAKKVISRIVKDSNNEIDIDYIQNTVANYFKITKEKMKDKIRKKEIVIARQVAMYFSKDFTNHSLKSIGNHFGGRDHSTVIHAVQSVNDMIDTDNIFRNSIKDLKKKFQIKSL